MTEHSETTQMPIADPDVEADADDVVEVDTPRRSRLVTVFIVIAAFIALLAAVTVWADRQFLDTDGWVDTSDEMLANDDVREALSTYIVDELYRSKLVEEQLDEQLPEDLRGLAGVLAPALRDPAINTVDSLLRTDAVRTIWAEANRTAHEALVAVLNDDVSAGISTADGKVTLDIGEMVRALGIELDFAEDLLSDLPDDAGQITLVESEELGTAQAAVKAVTVLSVLFVLIVIGLFALAIYLARAYRREALRDTGWALVTSGVVVLLLQRVALNAGVEALTDASDSHEAARAVLEIGTSMLTDIGLSFVAVGLIFAMYAVLVGPTSFATAIRRALAPIFNLEPWLVWIGVAGLVLLYLAVRPPGLIESWLGGVFVLALFIAAVESFRRREVREFPDASFDDWRDWWSSRRHHDDDDVVATQDVDDLERLYRLHESGGLSEDEYATAKQAILSGAPDS